MRTTVGSMLRTGLWLAGLGWMVLLVVSCGATTHSDPSAEPRLSDDEQARRVYEVLRLRSTNTAFVLDSVDIGPFERVAFFEATPRSAESTSGVVRCVVHGEDVTCTPSEVMTAVVAAQRLGSRPDQLTDEEWILFCRWVLEPEILANAAVQRSGGPEVVGDPQIERMPLAGVRVTLYYAAGGSPTYPQVPKGLLRVDIRVNQDDTVQVTEHTFQQAK